MRGRVRGYSEDPTSLAEIGQWEAGVVGKGPCGLLCFSMTILCPPVWVEDVLEGQSPGQEDPLQGMSLSGGWGWGVGSGVEIQNSCEQCGRGA